MSEANTPNTGSKSAADGAPITIKKYANRRLYNTASSSYVTLDHLSQMVKDGVDFVVFDAKTGEDITRSVLTQIIVEEESKGGQNLLPISFLRQLIGFYGDSLGGLVPRYLDYSMQAFSRNEQQMRQYMGQALDGLFPFNPFEEVGKQNMAFFENAMKMFSPFYQEGMRPPGMPGMPGMPIPPFNLVPGAAPNAQPQTSAQTPAQQNAPVSDNRMEDLYARISALQNQVEELSKKK